MRKYSNVEPKLARLLEPGDRYPTEKVIESVVKTTADVLVTFDDGSSMRLAYEDALLVGTPPVDPSPASESQDAAAVAAAVLADAEPMEDAPDEVDSAEDDTGASVVTPKGKAN